MGIIDLWQDEVFSAVNSLVKNAKLSFVSNHCIIDAQNGILVHLIPLINKFNPEDLIALQNKYQNENKQIIHLWEDVWLNKKNQVLIRFKSLFSQNIGFHARKTKIVDLTINDSKVFLESNHLQGYVKAKYAFGLADKSEIIAVATFSDARPMKLKGNDYLSAELVRFASKDGVTVVGGLSKLIKHFSKQIQVNDIMSYADKDWSLGKGYEKLNFLQTAETEPLYFYVNAENLHRYTPHRLPKDILLSFKAQNNLNLDEYLKELNYIKVFNTGNLKYHLYL